MAESNNPHDNIPPEMPPLPFDDITRRMPELSVAAQNIVSELDASKAQKALSGLPRPEIPIDTRTLVHQTFIDANRRDEPPQ